MFTDGGARGNPGPAAAGVVIKAKISANDVDFALVEQLGLFLGHCTNNEAEYQALILGLEKLLSLGATEVVCNLDSELVVKQLNGQYKVKNANMQAFVERVNKLKKDFTQISFVHVPREKNKEADKLVNEVLDASQ